MAACQGLWRGHIPGLCPLAAQPAKALRPHTPPNSLPTPTLTNTHTHTPAGIYDPAFIAANQEARADNLIKGSRQEQVDAVRAQIREFKEANDVDKVRPPGAYL